jgi:hypothetical protein
MTAQQQQIAVNAAAARWLTDILEEWRPIKGYEGLYDISNHGRVRSNHRGGRILAPGLNSNGYLSVSLHRDGQRRSWNVHRLVADEFCPRRPEQTVIRHLDGTRTNNHHSNLTWGTYSENTYDAVRHGTHKDARRTHCARGHAFDAGNTRKARGGTKRTCRTCSREWSRQYKARIRAMA